MAPRLACYLSGSGFLAPVPARPSTRGPHVPAVAPIAPRADPPRLAGLQDAGAGGDPLRGTEADRGGARRPRRALRRREAGHGGGPGRAAAAGALPAPD